MSTTNRSRGRIWNGYVLLPGDFRYSSLFTDELVLVLISNTLGTTATFAASETGLFFVDRGPRAGP